MIYIIPITEKGNVSDISIPVSGKSKWEKYRINENPYNETYSLMNIENCSVIKNNAIKN